MNTKEVGKYESEQVEKWTDQETGLPCLARLTSLGTWCGYVAVPVGHAAYGAEVENQHADKVHGSITFCKPCPSGFGFDNEDSWVFGFDCAHGELGDVIPNRRHEPFFELYEAMATLTGLPRGGVALEEAVRDLDFVKTECAKLAKLTAEITAEQVTA